MPLATLEHVTIVQDVVENDRVPHIDNRAHSRSYRVDEATEHRAEYGGDTLRLPRQGGCQQPGPLKNELVRLGLCW